MNRNYEWGWKVCSSCGQKRVGSRNAWWQDFTDQPFLCNKCINKFYRHGVSKIKGNIISPDNTVIYHENNSINT